MAIIEVNQLSKTFRVTAKEPGLGATLRHFIHRQYRRIEAVKALDFQIAPGEVVGFLGPNGAGKTTTLKMLTGLIHPSAGRVVVNGHNPFRRDPTFLHDITLVMGQKQQLIWDLPAMDSLRINAAVYNIAPAEFEQRVKELAQMLELHVQLHQPVRKLSLGERMKTELLAALLHRPKVLFLDEPTLGLDVNAQAAVRQFLADYNHRYGSTVLLTSHYMADITALCERVILIHDGELIYDGNLEGILHRFAPYREVRLELEVAVPEQMFAEYGQIRSIDGGVVRLIVERADLTDCVSRLLQNFAVSDLTVVDPPIEDVIGQIFRRGNSTTPTPESAQ